MPSEVTVSGADDAGPGKTARPLATSEAGAFTIYKRGQGYWTRMGTALAAVLLLVLITANLFQILNQTYQVNASIASGVAGGVGLALAIWSWRMMNKPRNVDFLIATDSEMKKVNWTSKKDLVGATKVVILFMFLIALILLVIDVIFGYFFQLITVLKTGPFG